MARQRFRTAGATPFPGARQWLQLLSEQGSIHETDDASSHLMAVRLNAPAFEFAQTLIRSGAALQDEEGIWAEHRPSVLREVEYLTQHGFESYSCWFLGIDDTADIGWRTRYRFPIGDFELIHRCGVLTAEMRAGRRGNHSVELAAAHLHRMLDGWC